jgi:hypothetical protein
MDKESRIEALRKELARVMVDRQALQADHARVLGLLAQVTEIADMMLKGTECEHDVGLCSCEHRRIVKQAWMVNREPRRTATIYFADAEGRREHE